MLSGGERRRLALAIVVASGANFLVLDEPTNHLDLESREALEAALEDFPATVLLVSHDRALLDAVAERTLAIEDGTIRSYDGGWADYVRARDAETFRTVSETSPRHRSGEPQAEAGLETHRAGQASSNGSRRRSTRQEETVADLERRLADDWGDVDLLAAHRARARRAPGAPRPLGDALRAGAGLSVGRR